MFRFLPLSLLSVCLVWHFVFSVDAELACPQGGSITRLQYCAVDPGCPDGEDSDNRCIQVADVPLGYMYHCGDTGDAVTLTAMCDGTIDCNNAEDETNEFCPGRHDLCLNGGTCVAGGACVCADGWTGTLCETAICVLSCDNGGTCIQPNICSCAEGWNGQICTSPLCQVDCFNDGVCIYNAVASIPVCACIDNWIGLQCEVRMSCYCVEGGQCSSISTDGYPSCDCQEGVICLPDPSSAGGDPHFLVSLPDNSNLCFSVQGEPGFAFNLVTSKTIVINAVFIKPPSRLQDWITVIGEIGVLYLTRSRSVVRMHFNFRDKSIFVSGYGTLDAKRVSRVIVDGDHLDVTTSNITHSWSSNVFVSVGSELKFIVFFNYDNLDLVWSDMSNFNQSSHGIFGQFFNQGTKVDTEKRLLVLPNRPPVPVTSKESHPELHHKTQCWQPTTPGYQGQGLLEGDYLEYAVDSLFATNFTYSLTLRFNHIP